MPAERLRSGVVMTPGRARRTLQPAPAFPLLLAAERREGEKEVEESPVDSSAARREIAGRPIEGGTERRDRTRAIAISERAPSRRYALPRRVKPRIGLRFTSTSTELVPAELYSRGRSIVWRAT